MTVKKSILFIHVDGLGHSQLAGNPECRDLDSVKMFINKGASLYKTDCPLPSNTLNFFARLFYSSQILMPGSRWYDRKSEKIFDIINFTSLNNLERELENKHTLLFDCGKLFGTLLGRKADSIGLIKSDLSVKNIRKSLLMLGPSALRKSHKLVSPKKYYLSVMESAMLRGVNTMITSLKQGKHHFYYINLMAYDQTCHKLGLHHHKTERISSITDAQINKLIRACDRIDVIPFIFSDHGMAPSVPLKKTWGLTLKELLHTYLQLDSDCRVLPSGNLAHVYINERISDTLIKQISKFSAHESIGLVLCHTEYANVSMFKNGDFLDIETLGEDQKTLKNELKKLASHSLSGDLVIFGAEIHGNAVNFMNQRACHNGFILGQKDSFLVSPIHLENAEGEDCVKLLRKVYETLSNS